MLRTILKFTGLGKLWGALAWLGAFLAALGLAWLRGRSEGLKTARVKQQEKTIENVEKAGRARRDPDRERVRKFDRPVK